MPCPATCIHTLEAQRMFRVGCSESADGAPAPAGVSRWGRLAAVLVLVACHALLANRVLGQDPAGPEPGYRRALRALDSNATAPVDVTSPVAPEAAEFVESLVLSNNSAPVMGSKAALAEEGTDAGETHADPMWNGWSCFCLYAGGCRRHFGCESSLTECQLHSCGQQPLDHSGSTVSFLNFQHPLDIITIPQTSFRDISALKHDSGDPASYLAAMLEAGRHVYASSMGKSAQQQVPGENLPASPPVASCASTSQSAMDVASQMLGVV